VGECVLDGVLLAEGPQVQMVLEQPSQQLSAVTFQVVLGLVVVHPPASAPPRVAASSAKAARERAKASSASTAASQASLS
jgi:hypothetical protein